MRFTGRHSIVVTVALPCPETWAQMTPTAQGRHCATCAQEVVDFTLKTDAELLAWFRQPGHGATCGRFRLDQLARPLLPMPPAPRWRSWLLAVLALWAGRAAAPAVAAAQSGPTRPLLPRPAMLRLPKPAQTITGQVVAAESLAPLAGVVVQVEGTAFQTTTDAEGRFGLVLPAPSAATGQPWQLTFRAPGYAPHRRSASVVDDQPIPLFFQAPESPDPDLVLGGVGLHSYGVRIVQREEPHGAPTLHLEDWLR